MNKKLKIGIGIILLLIGICYIYFFQNSKIVIPCIFHKLTGFFCPGCGITRCLNALIHFDFYQAFRYNAIVIIMLPFIVIYFIILFCDKLSKHNNKLYKRIPNWFWYFILVIVLLFGILRNIPDFEWLAPTIV